jgi:nascent polypeptide-associated complex subunit alpha
MFPGFGGMDPRQMKMMLKQLGIKSEEIAAKRVVFELEGKKIVIEAPQVTAMNMHGNKIYSVMGKEIEEKAEMEIPESDVLMVSEQAKVSKQEALNALKETKGDIAEAIQKLAK